MSNEQRKIRVAVCPHCGADHEFAVRVLIRLPGEERRQTRMARRQVALSCDDSRPFLAEVGIPLSPGQELVEVRPLIALGR